jgi:Zn-dependent protease
VVLAVIGAPIFGGAKPVPFNPNKVRGGEWGAALVAVAGPLTNLLIAFVVFGIGAVTGIITAEGVYNTFAGIVVWTAVQVNLGFFIFNILPIPPLDGSRVLYALAPEFIRRGMEVIERYGVLFVFILVLLASSVVGVVMGTIMQAILDGFMIVFRLT